VDTSGLSTAGEVSGSIVFVGYGIHAPQAHHDDYAGMDVKGKVVLVLDGFPGDSSHSPLAKFNDVRRKAAMARALGAVAFINVVTKDAFRRGIGRTLEEATDAGMPLMRVRSTIAEQWIREATQKGLPEIWDDADAGKFVSMPLGATAHLKTDIRKILKTSRT
jgi:hypothetical protein